MFKIQLTVILIPLFLLLNSCKSIHLEENNKTSELLHSQKEFGEDLDKLKYENKFILQIGYIDTTDEEPPIRTAIIKINEKDILMNFVESKTSNDSTVEVYANTDYKISLFYQKKEDDILHEIFYSGELVVETKGKKSEYSVKGTDSRL